MSHLHRDPAGRNYRYHRFSLLVVRLIKAVENYLDQGSEVVMQPMCAAYARAVAMYDTPEQSLIVISLMPHIEQK